MYIYQCEMFYYKQQKEQAEQAKKEQEQVEMVKMYLQARKEMIGAAKK